MALVSFRSACIALCLLAAWAAPPQADDAGAEPETAAQAAEQLGQRLQAAKADPQLDEAAKNETLAAYEEAISAVKSADGHTKRAADFDRRRQAAAQQIATARKTLAEPETAIDPGLTADAALAAWQQRLTALEEELNAAKGQLATLQAEPQRRADRRTEIANTAAQLRQRLEALEEGADVPVEGNTAVDPLQSARDDRDHAVRQAADQELRAGEAELAFYDATSELLPLERDLAARRVGALERVVAQLRQQINQRRADDAKRQEEIARVEAARAHPAVKALAEQNHELTVRRQGLAEQIQSAQQELDGIDARLDEVRGESQRTQARVRAAGLSNAVGSLLRRQRARLPDVRANAQERRRRQAALADMQLDWYELADERALLASIDERVDEIVPAPVGELQGTPAILLREAVRDAVVKRRDVLDAVLADYDSLHRLLVDLDTRQHELIDETVALTSYIDERVLWIHSLPPISQADVTSTAVATRDLLSPANWLRVGQTLLTDARGRPDMVLLALCLFVPPTLLHRKLRIRLRQQGERADAAYCESFAPTARALALTAIVAAAGPAAVLWISWRLTAPLVADGFCAAVATGLQIAALNYLLFECVLKVCRPWGLADAHFGWERAELGVLRRNVRWLALIAVPASFVVAVLETQSTEAGMSAAGRIAFVVALTALAVFVARVLAPHGRVLRGVMSSSHGRWLDRLRWLWFPAVVAVPGSLAVLASAGYYYTALRLTERLLVTLWLLLGVALATGLMWRWLLLARRSLAIKQARARRAALQAELKEGTAGGEAPLEVSQVDLSTINAQSKQLLRALMAVATMFGLWAVWVDVLPALSVLNGVQLWARGTENPITLTHLLLALLIVGMTAVAYRNIPGLLEITLLQRLPLEPGARYAITSVSRYLIAVVGLVLAFEEVGVGWSKVQWLLAAMSVGLGFGLQEIFANFVSGLIILFERPVRVGDVVTVGEVTGSVSRIRMRATTIVDGDRRELVIPNRTFITDRLMNWTLSDTVTRLSIPIGVPYGADVSLVESILLSAAREHPLVMADPAPGATFERFGGATVDFVLRVFLASTEHLGTVRHELNKTIERRLRAEGIEIAAPPQQVLLRRMDDATAGSIGRKKRADAA